MLLSRQVVGSIGLLFWIGMAGVAILSARRISDSGTGTHSSVTTQLARYATTRSRYVEATLFQGAVRRNDPVFCKTGADHWQQVGYVDHITVGSASSGVSIRWYNHDLAPHEYTFTLYENRGKFEDVIEMLLPPEKRQAIEQQLADAFHQHGDQLVATLGPLVQKSLQESAPILEDAFKVSFARHAKDFKKVGKQWEDTILKQKIVPLLENEVLPSVKEHAGPVAKDIGRELWDRASLWRFGWRALYDKAPLPERDLLKREWERFVDQEAIPTLKQHQDRILESQKQILKDLAKNERVQDEFKTILDTVVSDKELRRILKAVIKEAVVENEALRKVWTRNFQSKEAKAAFRGAGSYFEPVIRRIGDDLFGSKRTGIDPDFARVLRNQILGKDKRWIVATQKASNLTGVDAEIILHPGPRGTPFPLVVTPNEVPISSP